MTLDDILDILENTMLLLVDGPDDDLLDSGELDSMGFVDLIATVEERRGVRIPVADLDLDAMRTPRSIATTLSRALGEHISEAS